MIRFAYSFTLIFCQIFGLAAVTTSSTFGAEGSEKKYQVRPGQSLMTISHELYGTHQCWPLLLKANPQVIHRDQLEKNQQLNVPNPTECTHPHARKNRPKTTQLRATATESPKAASAPASATQIVAAPIDILAQKARPAQADPVEAQYLNQARAQELIFKWQGRSLKVPLQNRPKPFKSETI